MGDGGTARAAGASGSASSGASATASADSAQSAVASALLDNAAVNWLRTVSLGWPLIFFSIALYLAGLSGWLAQNRSGLAAFAADLRAAGADTEALRTTLRSGRYGVTTTWEHATAAILGDPTATASLLFAAGIVLVPSVFFVVIRRTRQYPGWRPTYLYVVATVAPAVGVAAAALGTLPLAAELLGYAVLPVIAFTALLLRGYVWPRARGVLG